MSLTPLEKQLETVIEAAVGGTYKMPDGRSFWIDAPVAREITRRVSSALAAREKE